ncbi:uncharacterized protein CTHT_0031480 [Thermochaetoides thermophila DSM 1495]|uniref:Major facilitator superfamily (MFS) profile domain-containing protein n=1 Tax=Chaetomium thermophilum (strain DSM 1495 / CBS 144.50 / IMI 039719) TaxID=759272 RepID=G0S4L9_CHATD|nr:hypothetical protein CTHT_0031480 [Thermochaetoides thermophila DSM 1495]EGS21294.1 hypothetical protein CTHT_0031480 [Thermochaetoides thermophila DSM 1495]
MNFARLSPTYRHGSQQDASAVVETTGEKLFDQTILLSLPSLAMCPNTSGAANVVPAEGNELSESSNAALEPQALRQISSGSVYSVFSNPTKRWIIAMASFAGFVSPMTANIYFPALNSIAKDLDVSVHLINLTLTTYMIFQAIAPTLVGDFGDMAGRRPALFAERGKYMGFVGAGINIGPALSPVLGGILAEYLGWRAIFWFCLIYAAVWLIPYALAVPETCRNVVGNGSIPARGWNMTLIDLFRRHRDKESQTIEAGVPKRKLRFPNPVHSLRVVFEKELALLLMYNTLIYLVFILIAATVSTTFADIYHLNDLELGLCYLPYGFGCCVAAIVQGYILDYNYRRIARKIGFTIDYKRGDDLSKFPIEKARLMPVYPILSAGIIAVICYGWVLQFETNLAGPLVLLFVVGLCVTGSFSILNTLVVDLYPEAPATAVAANNLVRCLFGAAGTAFIESMLQAMGRGWTYTFWALILVIFSPTLWVLSVWGPEWREERRVRKLKAKEQETKGKQAAEGS